MALISGEIIAIVAVLLVIFLWGPNKIPELAKAVGQAKGEFDRAKRTITTFETNTMTAAPAPAQVGTHNENTLVTAARKLGIVTEGKTKEEILKEVITKSTPPETPPAPSK